MAQSLSVANAFRTARGPCPKAASSVPPSAAGWNMTVMNKAGIANQAKPPRPDLLLDVEALGAHARHHFALRGGKGFRTRGRHVALLAERRDPGPEEPALASRRGGARLLLRKVGHKPVQFASRRRHVCAPKPLVEFLDR